MAKILLMDDDMDQAELLAAILKREGHDVTLAADSSLAMVQIDSAVFDVVVTDIFVREKNVLVANAGLRLIEHIRSDSRAADNATPANVPVIAMSGVFGGPSDGHFLELAEGLGANIRLKKPVPASILCSAIDKLLSQGM